MKNSTRYAAALTLTPAITGLAAIQYSGSQDIAVNQSGFNGAQGIDINGDSVLDLAVFQGSAAGKFAFNNDSLFTSYIGAPANTNFRIAALTTQNQAVLYSAGHGLLGTPGSSFPGRQMVTNQVINQTTATASTSYFLAFHDPDIGHGWLRFTQDSSRNIVINDWAYQDTPGQHISAGEGAVASSPVPEPSSAALMTLGMLAAGAGGIREFRRRKKEAAENATETTVA